MNIPDKNKKEATKDEGRLVSLKVGSLFLGTLILTLIVLTVLGILDKAWIHGAILFLGMVLNLILAVLFSTEEKKYLVALTLAFSLLLAILLILVIIGTVLGTI